LNGFEKLAQTTHERNIIVWLNEYFGEVEGFADLKVTQDNLEKLVGSVMIRERKLGQIRSLWLTSATLRSGKLYWNATLWLST
jgi:hypothetical protein